MRIGSSRIKTRQSRQASLAGIAKDVCTKEVGGEEGEGETRAELHKKQIEFAEQGSSEMPRCFVFSAVVAT